MVGKRTEMPVVAAVLSIAGKSFLFTAFLLSFKFFFYYYNELPVQDT
jgi:hypothetical protein